MCCAIFAWNAIIYQDWLRTDTKKLTKRGRPFYAEYALPGQLSTELTNQLQLRVEPRPTGLHLAGPGPIIDSLDSWVGAPGDSVVIRGVNFNPVAAVWFGNEQAGFSVVADTQIKVSVPFAASGKITLASALGRISPPQFL